MQTKGERILLLENLYMIIFLGLVQRQNDRINYLFPSCLCSFHIKQIISIISIYDLLKWVFLLFFFLTTVLPTPVFHFTFYSPSSAVWLMIISVIYVRDFHLKDHVSLNVFFLFILLLTHVISPLIWHHLTAHYTSMMWSVNIYNVRVSFIF